MAPMAFSALVYPPNTFDTMILAAVRFLFLDPVHDEEEDEEEEDDEEEDEEDEEEGSASNASFLRG